MRQKVVRLFSLFEHKQRVAGGLEGGAVWGGRETREGAPEEGRAAMSGTNKQFNMHSTSGGDGDGDGDGDGEEMVTETGTETETEMETEMETETEAKTEYKQGAAGGLGGGAMRGERRPERRRAELRG